MNLTVAMMPVGRCEIPPKYPKVSYHMLQWFFVGWLCQEKLLQAMIDVVNEAASSQAEAAVA